LEFAFTGVKMKKLKLNSFARNFGYSIALSIILILPVSIIAQSKITVPKNKTNISKDLEIGSKTSAQVEQLFPMVNDRASDAYINQIGMRLANAVPSEFQHREFNCRFKIVNASDINAFALPGCWLYVNRGMIEAAKNEGEMAGVMAHEISHSMLRHGTAQGPGLGKQLGALGAMLGGAVLGVPELGQAGAAFLITPYSRSFEKNSDLLGANIMARAGYDPRDLANMFQTIAGENGGQRSPERLSSHPDPGNRFEYINKEAEMLRVSGNPIKITPGFQATQRYLRSLPKAKTMAEIEKGAQGQAGTNPTSGGKYENRVPAPSTRTRQYNAGNVLTANVPDNWKEFPGQNSIQLAPQGAYGADGITHGIMMGVEKGNGGNLQNETSTYVDGLLKGNTYLRQQGNYSRGTISGRNALSLTLSGRSPVTNNTEIVTVYTAQLRNGELFYLISVSPQDEANNYSRTFSNIVRSIQINDR
jgi:beta-barrel assembly-enhancing protease